MYQIKEEIEDKSLQYPSYYTVPFHGARRAAPLWGVAAGWLGALCKHLQAAVSSAAAAHKT